MRVGVRIIENSDVRYQLYALAVYRWLEEKNYHPTMIVGDGWIDGYILGHCDNVDSCSDALFDSVVVIDSNLRKVIGEPLFLLSAEFYRHIANSKTETKLTAYIKDIEESDIVTAETYDDLVLALLFNNLFTIENNDTKTTELLNSLNISDVWHIDYNTVNREISNMAGIVAGRLMTKVSTRIGVGTANQTVRRHRGLTEFKIQNILLPDCDWKYEHWWMMHRGERLEYSPEDKVWLLRAGTIEFFTYLNSLSVKKWNEYSCAADYVLHLKIRGKFSVKFFGHWLETKENSTNQSLREQIEHIKQLDIPDIKQRDFIRKTVAEAKIGYEEFPAREFDTRRTGGSDTVAEVVIPVEYVKSAIVGFTVTAVTECEIFEGYWTAKSEKSLLNNVNIAICTTTFKKERFILENLKNIRTEIFEITQYAAGMDELAQHLFVNVVDNGKTLSKSDVDSANIKLYPNPNTGGAGGFSRGMLETVSLREKGAFDATHVIFMDDDVKILPESLKRTYALLRLMKPEYSGRFISGAMLNLHQMNEQFEDLGFVSDADNSCGPLKPRFYLHLMEDILRNEEDFTLHNAYAAWWYCCVPIKYVGNDKLSYPIFYRGDDVNFSLRNNPGFITMNGICIWHLMLNAKVTTSLEFYLANRNMLTVQALDGTSPSVSFFDWITARFHEELRKFNYIACEEAMDAVEDFLKGPNYLAKLPHDYVLKVHGVKNETLIPVSNWGNVDLSKAYEYIPLSKYDMQIFLESDNGHTLPDNLLRNDMPAVAHLFFESPGKQYLCKSILAVDIHNKIGVLHTMDREKYNVLKRRYAKLAQKWELTIDSVREAYKQAAPLLRSESFWRKYLGV